MDDTRISRRESIKKLLKISGGLALGSVVSGTGPCPGLGIAETKKEGFLVEGIGESDGYAVKTLVRNVFEAAGGMKTFIARGDVVVIKPNLSWARAPHLAATTNPEVLEAVIELCQEAGAKKVRIVDNTIHNARRCFAITGVGKVVENTGADLVFPRSSMMRERNLHGHRLSVWEVFVPFIEADKVINLPIAKHHNLSGLSLGMKNWIGAVGGRRNALHQDIHQVIVDLAQYFKPTLTLIDAIRIMIHNGPSGGRESDVAIKNRLILSNDPVAADAKAAALFDIQPEKIGFIQLADKWGLGTHDLNRLTQQSVTL
ncbi:MAG: DUF362 domain-containing protein [Desulfobacterales bacterium]